MKIILVVVMLVCTNSFAQTSIDYRYAQSSVKNQAARGTCTAFGICAAFEVFPGVPSNLSEQYLFAKIKYDHINYKDEWSLIGKGDFLKYYTRVLNTYGVVSEEVMPYDGSKPIATNDEDLFKQYLNITNYVSEEEITKVQKESYQLVEDQYTYYGLNEVKDIENIKQALRNGVKAIPVCYSIHTAQWGDNRLSLYLNPVIGLDGLINVEQEGKFISIKEAKIKDSLVEEKILTDKINVQANLWSKEQKKYCFTDGGHCVAIVGYNKDGFIIKNSWGKGWADKGYATISYNYHKAFATEALVLKNFYIKKTAVASPFDILDENQIRLKTTPIENNLQQGMLCSFFYEGPRIFPEFEKIEMRFYEENGYGQRNFIGYCFPEISEDNHNKGYLVQLPLFIVTKITNGKKLTCEIDFTYNVGTRKILAIYPSIEWKNKTLKTNVGEVVSTDE
jgi:Papain family cysteine protease